MSAGEPRRIRSASPHVVAECFAEERAEQPVKVEWREIRDAGENVQFELAVEVAIDVLDHRVHALLVFGLAATGSGHAFGVPLRSAIGRDRRCGPWTNRKASSPR